MFRLTLMLIAPTLAEVTQSQLQEVEPSRRFNLLTKSYDHCKTPQVLNRTTWTCDCPEPFQKKGDQCHCYDCLFERREDSYKEADVKRLPNYLSGFLRKMEEEEEEKKLASEDKNPIGTRMLWKTKNTWKNNSSEFLASPSFKKILSSLKAYCEDRNSVSCQWFADRMVFSDTKNTNIDRFLQGLNLTSWRTQKERNRLRMMKVDWDRARILTLRKIKKPEMKMPKEVEGTSISDTVIGNQTKRFMLSGDDKVFGVVSSLFGTGSLSLAAGEGGAASSAHTGKGFSAVGVSSLGATSFGIGMVGKMAVRGAATATALLGKGDAIATNTQSETGAASATAVSTNIVASAGSAAHGPATAAASASPGRGRSSSSSGYGEKLHASTTVTGKSGTFAESVAVGDPKDSIQDLREKHSPQEGHLLQKYAAINNLDSSWLEQ